MGNSCCCLHIDFYPRPPRGGRPSAAATVSITMPFLSTPSARRATPQWSLNRLFIFISIHALREEGDGLRLQGQTRPADFYPRPPRGGRQEFSHLIDGAIDISIHALREEGDLLLGVPADRPKVFLSTPSARRATPCCYIPRTAWSDFYPRPPRGGRLQRAPRPSSLVYFYPRPPRGGRPTTRCSPTTTKIFLSTPSARRATRKPGSGAEPKAISIHALREEGDTHVSFPCFHARLFLSTPSARRATQARSGHQVAQDISIHALREEGDSRPRR